MTRGWYWLMTIALVGVSASSARSAGTSLEQALSLKPVQAHVDYDQPPRAKYAECKLQVMKKPRHGWVVRDPRGIVIRLFLDTNSDNVVDQWSYYKDGQEVYRDIDSDFNRKPDQHRWYHSGGSRWASDTNEDGTIDSWKAISAEEVAAEAHAAIIARDFARLKRILLSTDDAKELGLTGDGNTRLTKSARDWSSEFDKVTREYPRNAEFGRMDANRPMAVPASLASSKKDLILYQNATIIAKVGSRNVWLRAPELVKVGDTWKLSAVPRMMDDDKPLAYAGVLVPAESPALAPNDTDVASNDANDTTTKPAGGMTTKNDPETTNAGGSDSTPPKANPNVAAAQREMIEKHPDIEKYVGELSKLDQKLPSDPNDVKGLVAYHVKRAEYCARIGSKCKRLKTREYWYKQTADSYNTAVQTGQYMQGVRVLMQYAQQFGKTNWGQELAAYFQYRAINSEYAVELSKPDTDYAKAQDKFLEKLEDFLKKYSKASDAPDALWQLGNGQELSGKEDNAKETYRKLVMTYPNSKTKDKAQGGLRRLDGQGKAFRLIGGDLSTGKKIDSQDYKGKVILITYWATWCEPCKRHLGTLKKLKAKYGDKGFEIVGVCLDGEKSTGQQLMKDTGCTWPNIFEQGALDSPPAVEYGIISLPYMMLVDADGRIINPNLQFVNVEASLEQAMAKKVARRNR